MGKTNNKNNTGRRIHGRKLNREKNKENRVRRNRTVVSGGLSDPRAERVRKEYLEQRDRQARQRSDRLVAKGPCCSTQEALVARNIRMHKELVSAGSRAYNTTTGTHDILVIDAWFRSANSRHMAHFRLYLRENNIRTVG